MKFLRKKGRTAAIVSPCANRGSALQGPWRHACGQLGEDFHHSVTRLAGEVFAGLIHFDGRLWRTLPSLIFVFQRRLEVFDHAIFSLHSLSAMGLLLTVGILLDPVTRGGANLLLMLPPIHLFRHMRGVYRSSWYGTLLRMFVLFTASMIGFMVLILGLISVGLNAMG